ncbi:MAG: SAM-dependent methyltransferase [Deltaproteobacteria bacterium]|nr:SAM-dependent methyltransferase [Deltaproteobacteria bacterium]
MDSKSYHQGLDDTLRCVRGAISAKLLLSALEQDVFTDLDTPKSLAAISARHGWQTAATEKFCEILSHLGLVVMRAGTVRNTERTSRLFSKHSEDNIGAFVLESCRWCLHPLDDLPRVLRQGAKPPEHETNPEATWHELTANGAGVVLASGGAIMAEYLAALPGARRYRRMLDLGGGHGGYALRAAEAMPWMEVDVLDFPAVLQVAERFREKSPAKDRVRMLPANYVTEPIPGGYDLVLVSATLNFTLADNATQNVMDKIHAALNPGGFCVSVHDGPVDEKLMPEWPFECLVTDLVTGTPMAMPAGLVADTMFASGFSHVRTEYLRLNGSLMTVDMGRKSNL